MPTPGPNSACKQAQIVRRQKQVAVGHHDPVAAGRRPALGDIVQLGIAGDAVVTDQKPGLHLRMRRHQIADQRHHGIAFDRHAEQQFIVGIILQEGRSQRRLVLGVAPADRSDQADLRAGFLRFGRGAGQMAGGKNQTGALDPGKRQRRKRADQAQGSDHRSSFTFRPQAHRAGASGFWRLRHRPRVRASAPVAGHLPVFRSRQRNGQANRRNWHR